MTRRQGVRLATLFTVVILAFYAFGYWQSRPEAPEPMQWQERYQANLLTPLHEQQLTLGDAGAVLGHGTLWMISSEGEPLLVSRYTMESDDLSWRVQAVIGLTPEQTESLVQAQAWQPELPDQPINSAVGDALKDRKIVRLSLIPNEPMSLACIMRSISASMTAFSKLKVRPDSSHPIPCAMTLQWPICVAQSAFMLSNA